MDPIFARQVFVTISDALVPSGKGRKMCAVKLPASVSLQHRAALKPTGLAAHLVVWRCDGSKSTMNPKLLLPLIAWVSQIPLPSQHDSLDFASYLIELIGFVVLGILTVLMWLRELLDFCMVATCERVYIKLPFSQWYFWSTWPVTRQNGQWVHWDRTTIHESDDQWS